MATQQKLMPDDKKWVDPTVHALTAPLIVWPGEEDSFRFKVPDVKLARLRKLADGDLEERATDLEVALYMSSYSLSAPPSETEFNVYMYAFRRSFGDKVVDEAIGPEDGRHLDYQEKELYDNLARWIYKRQKEHLKRQDKERKEREDGIQVKMERFFT